VKHEITFACSMLLALAGCAAAPRGAPVPTDKPQSPIAAQSPAVDPSSPAVDAPPAPAPAAAAPEEPIATPAPTPPAPAAAPQSAVASTPAAKATPQSGASKPKPAAAPKQGTPTPAPAASAAARPAAAPSLDLTSLEQRLRDTHAIGLFTKLSIKNQVDDLLDEFRAHFRGQGSPPLAELRQRYDLLLMKVLSSVQDGDPPLANDIASSREAIWKLLNDPAKLTSV
jgi:hypothetical protein